MFTVHLGNPPAYETNEQMNFPPNAVISQPIAANFTTPSLAPHAFDTYCGRCETNIFTSIEYKNGPLTWILCVVIAIFGGILGCCLIPFCCRDCQDVEHTCPRCRQFLGIYKRI
ncbi:hypothetical protein P879_01328 [Paragonimus westermani]|uniref:LITAF domain-containing protein n=1 Tax=Paragonimus westermani TaxID=34504 RepID=A0A8T0DIV3_9TREM|nr:hypothetical protein P879_01328 [Paragonimus westermani]